MQQIVDVILLVGICFASLYSCDIISGLLRLATKFTFLFVYKVMVIFEYKDLLIYNDMVLYARQYGNMWLFYTVR